MAAHAEAANIAEIVNFLEDRKNKTPKVALILGSRTGALFRSEYLYEELQFYSTRAFTDMTQWERFSECYNVLQKSDEQMSKGELVKILKHALSNIDFSKADTSLAELIKLNIFKIIISANSDDLLYDALVSVSMKEGRDFIDHSLSSHLIQDELIEEVAHSNKPDACKIVRISDEPKKLIYNLNQPAVQEANGRFVTRLLERLRIKEVVAIGLDPLWDSALISMLPAKSKTVWFVNEDPTVMWQFLLKNQVEQCRHIIGENGSYEQFLIALYWSINKGIPKHDELLLDILNQMNSMQRQLMEVKSIVERLEKEKQ
jgi:hypothetical protein